MPRRMAYFDYTHPALQPQAWTVTASTIGGLLLVVSALLFVYILARGAQGPTPRRRPSPSARRCTCRRAHAGRAERLRAVGRDDDRPHGRELRLPDRAARDAEGSVGAGHSDREPMMQRAAACTRGAIRWFRWSVVVARRADGRSRCWSASSWLPSVQGDFTRAGHLGEHLPRGGRARRMGRRDAHGQERAPGSTDVVLERSDGARGRQRRRRPRRDARAQNARMCHGAQGMSDAECAEPGRAVSRSRHQAAARLQERRPRERDHASARAEPVGPRHRRPRGLLRLAAEGAHGPGQTRRDHAPALVRVGDPLRNIAPCISCHGGIDHKLGAPWLEGMPKDYLVRSAEGLRVRRAAQRQPRRRCATWRGR